MAATRTISTKLAVEGESQYKAAIASCNSELTMLKSSLALVESQYKGNANSMEALTAKGKALDDVYKSQQNKVSELEKALTNAKSAQETYSARVTTAKEKVAEYEKALQDLEGSTEDTSEEQAALTAELDKWNAELVEAQGYQTAAEKSVNNWQTQLNKANIELNGLSDEIASNNQYLGEAEQSADGCASSIDEFGKRVKNASGEVDDLGDEVEDTTDDMEDFEDETSGSADAINSLAAALAAGGIAQAIKAVAEAMLECAEVASSFETSIAKLSTLADTTVVPMDSLKSSLMSLSRETGTAVESLTEAAYQALSAGVDTANVVDFVATATKLSAAGFTESATAVDVMTTALNAYGLEGSEAERVASMLVKTQDLGKTSVDELAASMGRVIPSAAAYNVGLDNLATAYAELTKRGQNTALATTNIGAMLDELGKSSSNVAKILEEETGKSFADLMAEGNSLGDIINILAESVDGNSTAFSNLWGSTTATKAALALFNTGAEEFNKTLGEMQNSSGMVDRNFQIMADTTEFAHQRMTTAAQNLQIAIGSQLNPTLEVLYDLGANAFNWATDFVTEHPAVLSAVMGLATALAVLLGTLTAYTAIQAILPKVIALLKAFNTVLMTNPAIAIAAAVAGLAVAIGTLVISLGSADKETKAFTKSLEESNEAYQELTSSMEAEQKSTAATKDALLELMAVEEKSTAQKDAMKGMVEELNESMPELALVYNEVTGEIDMTAEAIDRLVEKAAAQEEYEAQVARLSELYSEQAEASARLQEAQDALTEAEETGAGGTRTLKNNVKELTAAEAELAAQIAELEAASYEYGEHQAQIAAQTAEMETRVNTLVTEITNLQAAYDASYTAAYDSISQQLGLFTELDATAKTSIDNLIGSLQSQIDYMDTYAANIQKAMELGVDQGLVQKLSDGSEESAQILAAIVAGGEEDIALLNEKLAQVEEGKENFSETVAEMETDFNTKMTELVADLDAAIAEMDVSGEAEVIGADNIQGLINGSASKKQELVATYTDMANAALAAYKRVMAQMSPSKKMIEAGRYDWDGLIIAAKQKEAEVKAAYGGMAQAALDEIDKATPRTIEEPSVTAQQERQTAALVRALSVEKEGKGDTYVTINSPEAMDEKTAAREFKKAQRDLSLDVS